MSDFDIVGPEAIRDGVATDAYFERTEATLRHAGKNPRVVAEVTADQFPDGDFELFAGVKDAAELLAGRDIDVDAMPEGTLFDGGPVMRIEGDYLEFAGSKPRFSASSHTRPVSRRAALEARAPRPTRRCCRSARDTSTPPSPRWSSGALWAVSTASRTSPRARSSTGTLVGRCPTRS